MLQFMSINLSGNERNKKCRIPVDLFDSIELFKSVLRQSIVTCVTGTHVCRGPSETELVYIFS